MDIVYVYPRKRRNFLRPYNFTLKEAESLKDIYGKSVDVKPDPSLRSSFILRDPIDEETQCREEMSEHHVNTEHVSVQTRGMYHCEGGWPKDVDRTEKDHVERHRRKIAKDDEFIAHLKKLGESVKETIMENNAIDIYEEYFVNDVEDQSSEPPAINTLSVFRDPQAQTRTATHIAWYPDSGSKIAVAYANLRFRGTQEGVALNSYVWDIENPNSPDLELVPSSPLWCLEYNNKDPHILAGGSYNGLVALWDTRKGSAPVSSSTVDRSHRDPVHALKWIQSKSGTEFFSVSTDGQVYWWDMRKMAEPIESLPIHEKGDDTLLGGVVLDYEWTMPTKFMVGTEQGAVISCNRKAKAMQDKVVASFTGHHGPIYALQRNPFFPKYFLTVGDWTVRIWMEDVRTAIITSRYHSSYLTGGMWSPTRPGVFLTSKMDGCVDVWDYLHKQNDPALSVQVSPEPIYSLSIQSQGRLVAVGGRDGSTTLLELSESLVQQQNQEKNIISQMFDRETKREKILDTRAKEMRIKSKNKTDGLAAKLEELEEVSDDVLREAEREFFDIVRQTEEEQKALMESSADAAAAATASAAAASSGPPAGPSAGASASASVSADANGTTVAAGGHGVAEY